MASTIAFVPLGEDSFLFDMMTVSRGDAPRGMSAGFMAGLATPAAFAAR